ncbi:MAG TPA: DUF4339 domain-containing protein [Candidatus Faecalicoccus intestinipullorum]|nr:DUF4339 domain-containing protein [Candidatus Faecalicoccus intestinipullorum]
MQCKKCGVDLPENAKFCPECGAPVIQENIVEDAKIEEPEVSVTEEAVVEESEETVTEQPVEEEVVEEVVEEESSPKEDFSEDKKEEPSKVWYYVKNDQAMGPYSVEEMTAFLKSKTINGDTLVWKQGMEDWVKLKSTEIPVPDMSSTEQWYYVDAKNAQNGPYTREQMETLIQARQIFGNTFVWKTGMADWKRLKETELASLATPESPKPQYQSYNDQSSANTTGKSNGQIFIMERSIGLSIVLTFVTCGIYSYYWLYCLARDINACCNVQNKPRVAEPGIVVLLTIVTCGLYGIYFYWKAGKALAQLEFDNGFSVPDNSIIQLVMPILGLGIISMAICQSSLNDIARYAHR